MHHGSPSPGAWAWRGNDDLALEHIGGCGHEHEPPMRGWPSLVVTLFGIEMNVDGRPGYLGGVFRLLGCLDLDPSQPRLPCLANGLEPLGTKLPVAGKDGLSIRDSRKGIAANTLGELWTLARRDADDFFKG